MTRALSEAVRGHGRTIVVEGEAGIGKTHLIQALSEASRDAGMAIAQGVCDDGGALPFWPWTQVLSALGVGSVGGVATSQLAGASASELAGAHRRVIDSVVERVTAAARRQPLLVVLEDLHWSDPSTLRCFERLAQHSANFQLLLVGTLRDESSADLSRMLGGLAGQPNFDRLALVGLTRDELVQMVDQLGNRPLSDHEIDLLNERTGGNPFFVSELLRSVGDTGTLDSTVPAGVVDVVRRRLATMPEGLNDLLAIAGVIGQSFDLQLLARVAGKPLDNVFDLIDVAEAHHAVEPSHHDALRYQFHHAIVRDAILRGVQPLQRARLHHRVAEALDDGSAERPESWSHWWEARAIAPDAARTACRRAAEDAERRVATEDASLWWQRALTIEPHDSPRRAELLLGRGRNLVGWSRLDQQPPSPQRDLEESSDRPLGWKTLLEAIDLALATGNSEVARAAALAIGAGSASWHWSVFRQPIDDVAARVEALLEGVGDDDRWRATLLAILALARYNDADTASSDELSAEAVAVARRVGDERLLAHVLLCRARSIWRPGRDDERTVLVDEVLALDATPSQRASALLTRGVIRLQNIERAAAEADVAEVKRIARVEQLTAEDIEAQIFESPLAALDGDIERVWALGLDAIDRASRNLTPLVPLGFLGIYAIHSLEGRLAELEDEVRRYAPVHRIAMVDLLGPVLITKGDMEGLHRLADEDEWADPPFDWFWTVQQALRARVIVGLDDPVRARRQLDLLAPHSGTAIVVPGFGLEGLVDSHLGALALACGDPNLALLYHENAVHQATRMRSRVWMDTTKAQLDITRQRASGH